MRYFRHIDLEKNILEEFDEIMTDAHEVLLEPTELLTDKYLFLLIGGMAKFSVTCGHNETIMSLSNVKSQNNLDSKDFWYILIYYKPTIHLHD